MHVPVLGSIGCVRCTECPPKRVKFYVMMNVFVISKNRKIMINQHWKNWSMKKMKAQLILWAVNNIQRWSKESDGIKVEIILILWLHWKLLINVLDYVKNKIFMYSAMLIEVHLQAKRLAMKIWYRVLKIMALYCFY